MKKIKKSLKSFVSLLSLFYIIFLLSESALAQDWPDRNGNGQIQRRGGRSSGPNRREDRRNQRGERGEVFTIEMNDFVYRGESSFNIKQLIRERFGRRGLGKARLERLSVIAKSRRGHGSAQLHILNHTEGRRHIQERGIPGVSNKSQWASSDRYTYHRVNFDLGRRHGHHHDSRGGWILLLKGRVKVKRIVAVIERRPPHSRPDPHNRYTFSLGEIKISKLFFGHTFFYRIAVDKSFVNQINVFCKSRRFEIFSFRAFFRDGSSVSFPELRGAYTGGQSYSALLPAPYNRLHLSHIEFEAVSPYFRGSRSIMEIGMEALR